MAVTTTSNKAAETSVIRGFIRRIEANQAAQRKLTEDLAEIYAEAKAAGLDTKIIKKAIVIRAADPLLRQEEENLVELYVTAAQETD